MPIVYREATYSDYKKGYARLELDGNTYYYLDGKLHRLDGPAWVTGATEDFGSYWINGEALNGDDCQELIKALKCPVRDLPLYINNEKIKPAIMYKLKEEKIIL